jgi:AcrR family transcriptional regulator
MTQTTNTRTVLAGRRARAEKNDDYQARRKLLIEEAANLFHTRGLRETSLADIAAAGGIDRATIYYYFSNKEEIVAEVLREALTDTVAEHRRIAASELAPDVKLRQMIAASMEAFDRHYPHMFVYVRADIERSLISRELRRFLQRNARAELALWQDVIAEGVDAGTFETDLPLHVAASAVLGALTSAHWWYQPGGPDAPSVLADGIADLVLAGLRKRRSTR